MRRATGARVFLLGLLLAAGAVQAAGLEPVAIAPENRLAADAAEWRELGERLARQPDTRAEFEEKRTFPFRREPIVLRGEVRVSREHGLSLRYTAPEERVVILDDLGMLVRDATGQLLPPDPRANVANRALLHVLRLDVAALEKEFEVYGKREGDAWALTLVPRAEETRRAIGNIHVGGEGAVVRTIDLKRSAKQHIAIAMAPPRAPEPFTADEVKQYFR